jgi:hypothetical protein
MPESTLSPQSGTMNLATGQNSSIQKMKSSLHGRGSQICLIRDCKAFKCAIAGTQLAESVVDRHRPMPNLIQIRPSILLLIRVRILHKVLHMRIFFYFYSQQCQFTLFYLTRRSHRCHNFQYF